MLKPQDQREVSDLPVIFLKMFSVLKGSRWDPMSRTVLSFVLNMCRTQF